MRPATILLLRPSVVASLGIHALLFSVVIARSDLPGRPGPERESMYTVLGAAAAEELSGPSAASEEPDALPEVLLEDPEAPPLLDEREPVPDAPAPLDSPDSPEQVGVPFIAPSSALSAPVANGRVARLRHRVAGSPATLPTADGVAAASRERTGVMTAPRPLPSNRRPVYPLEARLNGWQGVAVLRVTIRADGTIASVALETSTGYPLLDSAAEEAVRDWTFSSPLRDGVPTEVTLRVPVTFRLT